MCIGYHDLLRMSTKILRIFQVFVLLLILPKIYAADELINKKGKSLF
jgi:hypothetical protein